MYRYDIDEIIEDPNRLKEMTVENLGDTTYARVDIDKKYDINFAKEFIERDEKTTSYDETSLSSDIRLNALAEDILHEAFRQGRSGESISDIQVVEWEYVGIVRYKQGNVWKISRVIVKEAVEPLNIVFKKLSGVDVASKGKADITGRISRVYDGSEVVFRVAFSPNIRGTTTTARLLDNKTLDIGLDDLGMPDEYVEMIKQQLESRNGMIILSGGKGEGKTTTIYAMLLHMLNKYKGEKNIMTLENPPEYIVDGIIQSSIDEYLGYTYAKATQVKFRETPDILLSGEMNDAESVYATIDIGTGGNTTISSIHGNSSVEIHKVVANRSHQKVTMDMVGNAFKLLIHQALMKKLCPRCKREVILPNEDVSWVQKKLMTEEVPLTHSIEGDDENCPECDGKGYKGLVLIVELVDASAKAYKEGVQLYTNDVEKLKEHLLADGYSNYKPLEKDVLRRFNDGDITLLQAKQLVN